MAWSGLDQRKFPRIRHACVVSLRQATARPSLATTTENIGVGGICVLLGQGLDIFAPVDVELALNDGHPPIACRGMVAWVVRRRELNRPPIFDTGIEFVNLAPDDHARVERLLAGVPTS
ncbi:MAG: PilZ domain-containing protein [Candidatus Omnitrophica bacterium]|nr:PilZ domain-containing protein [Candidatus Omnitrophota bacterium]